MPITWEFLFNSLHREIVAAKWKLALRTLKSYKRNKSVITQKAARLLVSHIPINVFGQEKEDSQLICALWNTDKPMADTVL